MIEWKVFSSKVRTSSSLKTELVKFLFYGYSFVKISQSWMIRRVSKDPKLVKTSFELTCLICI